MALSERLREIKEHEEQLRRQAYYDEVAAVRDELAAELKQVYPAAAAQLADLMSRVAANDRMIEYVQAAALPRGASLLRSAELVARELPSFTAGIHTVPRITTNLRLPAFEFDAHGPYSWPPTR